MKQGKLKVFGRSFLATVLGFACLTGCATDGKNGGQGAAGNPGTTWYTGTEDPNSTLGNIGDFYLETDDGDVWRKDQSGWSVISNIKGPEGEQGPVGNPAKNVEYRNNGTHIQWRYVGDTAWKDLVALNDIKGEDGKDGTSVYVGYDGYVWNGAERTGLKINDIADGVIETTLALKDNVYFEEKTIAAGTKVALIGHYMPTAKMTQYSDSEVTKITTYVSAAGKLDIGVLNLKTGAYTLKTTEDVVAGKNVIDVEINVGENETLVLGGSTTTVDLYKSTGVVGASDVFGAFSTDLDELTISKTNSVNDRLIVEVEADYDKLAETHVFPNITSQYPTSSISSMSTVVDTAAPFAYKDPSFLAGKHITKIGMPIKAVSNTNNAFITLYVIKTSTVKNFSTSAVRTIKLQFTNIEVNTWSYADCDIQLAADETLAIGANSGDTVDWGYTTDKSYTDYSFYANNGTDGNASILFDFVVRDMTSTTLEAHLERLEKAEEEAIVAAKKAKLVSALSAAGIRQFSILGDSISTFGGVSNDATNTNSTIGGNAVYYSGSNWGMTDVNHTWWKQAANEAGLNVLVNNSYSGDTVSGRGQNRSQQLHDDTVTGTQTSVINPDLIAVYLGINDFNSYGPKLAAGSFEAINWDTLIVDNGNGTYTYGSASTFAEYYAIMMHKLTTKYDADVFCFTLLPNGQMGSRPLSDLEAFNDAITKIAEKFGCGVVDLYNDSGINISNMSTYYADSSGQNLHPNQLGMDKITECFINALVEKYVG